ncbi:MAG: hypothetical protein HQ575_05805 [Candidatus Omnitrophica bacterium]|nr:hypothetical protein [Candidatus Omnitrophota bacterium]
MRKFFSVIILIFFLSQLVGCEAVMRKFTRKRKKKTIRPTFYQEGMAETRPHVELYMLHYTYWKTWHEELAAGAGKNAKRDRLACSEMMGNLSDMKKHLVEEKAKELDQYIKVIDGITKELQKGNSTSIRLGFLRQKLDKIKGRIMRKFYYKKVRDYIIPD